MTYLVGKIALDITASAPNNGRGEDNMAKVKYLTIGRGERIPYIRTLVTGKKGADAGRSIDTVANTGQYL